MASKHIFVGTEVLSQVNKKAFPLLNGFYFFGAEDH